MAGKWQLRILTALAQETPLRCAQLQHRCKAGSHSDRQGLKRALATLMAFGLIRRQARGVYGLSVGVGVIEYAYHQAMRHARRQREDAP